MVHLFRRFPRLPAGSGAWLARFAGVSLAVAANASQFDAAQWTLTDVGDTSPFVQLDIGSMITMSGPLDVHGSGSVSPLRMTLISGNMGVKGVTRYEATAINGGRVAIDWTYLSYDMPCYDNGGYFVNDTMTIVACNRGPAQGHAEFDVSDGDLFGFAVRTGDGFEGPGTFKIIAFSFTGTIDGGTCTPDFDGNGTLDLFDFLAFTNLFNANDPLADLDANGVHDLFDFLAFVNAFNAGC